MLIAIAMPNNFTLAIDDDKIRKSRQLAQQPISYQLTL